MADATQQIQRPPIFSFVVQGDIPNGGSTVTIDNILWPEWDMEIRQIKVSVYDQTGAIVESKNVRDELLAQFIAGNGSKPLSNVAIDVFDLQEMTRSLGYRPFRVAAKSAWKLVISRSNFVNGGSAVLTGAVRVKFAFIGTNDPAGT